MKDTMYFAPKSIEETLVLLEKFGEEASILAGGTDIVPRINYYELTPGALIYVGDLGLGYIRESDGKICIGAATTWTDLIMSPLLVNTMQVLCDAAKLGGTIATRNVGTIGGNLANASPAADLAPPLLVLEAKLLIVSKSEERLVEVKDFFIGPGKTVLKENELIKEIQIPIITSNAEFCKLGRRKAMTLSVFSAAVRLDLAGKDHPSPNQCSSARIALGSVAPTPMRCQKAEAVLKDKVIDKALIWECAVEAINETKPIDDQRATAWYRRKAGLSVVARTLAKAACIQID